MPGRHTQFSLSWLQRVDANLQFIGELCRRGEDKFHAYCRFCDVQIKCDNAGKSWLLQHAKHAEHIKAIKRVQDSMQSKLVFSSDEAIPSTSGATTSSVPTGKLTIINFPDASLSAEIVWLAKMAIGNYGLRSVDHFGDIQTDVS